jgi:hypothetical protein
MWVLLWPPNSVLTLSCAVTLRAISIQLINPPLPPLFKRGDGGILAKALTFQTNQFGEHIVGSGDDLGIGLESPLHGDHADKFRAEIHIGLLQ